MYRRSLAFLASSSLVVLTACSSDADVTGTNSGTAMVRFVNATNSSINVVSNGVVGAGNSSIVFGGSSSCVTVSSANPGITITNSATNGAIGTFTPSFASGGNYTVVAYTDATGATQFATLSNTFTPTTGQSGLRVFNAAAGSGGVVVLSNGTVMNSGTTTAFGSGGSFFSIPAGAQTFTFNTGTGTTPFANSGSVTLVAGQNNTIVLGPPAIGTTALRSFIATGC